MARNKGTSWQNMGKVIKKISALYGKNNNKETLYYSWASSLSVPKNKQTSAGKRKYARQHLLYVWLHRFLCLPPLFSSRMPSTYFSPLYKRYFIPDDEVVLINLVQLNVSPIDFTDWYNIYSEICDFCAISAGQRQMVTLLHFTTVGRIRADIAAKVYFTISAGANSSAVPTLPDL